MADKSRSSLAGEGATLSLYVESTYWTMQGLNTSKCLHCIVILKPCKTAISLGVSLKKIDLPRGLSLQK